MDNETFDNLKLVSEICKAYCSLASSYIKRIEGVRRTGSPGGIMRVLEYRMKIKDITHKVMNVYDNRIVPSEELKDYLRSFGYRDPIVHSDCKGIKVK